MRSVLDLPEQDNRGDFHLNIYTEEGTIWRFANRSFGAQSLTAVERSRPIISIGERDNPDVTLIYGRVGNDVEPIYGRGLMA